MFVEIIDYVNSLDFVLESCNLALCYEMHYMHEDQELEIALSDLIIDEFYFRVDAMIEMASI